MRAPCGMPIIARPPGLPATSPHRQSRALARTARPDQSRSTRPPALCSTEPRQISLALPLVPLALDVATLTANSRAHRAAAQPLAPRRRPPDYPLRLGAVVPPSICRAAGALPTPGHSPLSRPALTLISHPRAPCIAPDEDRSEREIHSRGLGHTLTVHLRQRLLHVLNMLRLILHQHVPLPRLGARILARHEGRVWFDDDCDRRECIRARHLAKTAGHRLVE